MKNIQFFATALLLTIALFCTSNLSAQWSQNATSIWNTNVNLNLGIGTTAPSKKLEVNGGLRVINEVSIGGGNNFEVDAPGVAGGRFTIATNGNVGIGTNTPAKKLQVNGGDGLSFGFGPGATGEGIGNKRSAGGNQFGLDFYTNNFAQMSITNAGNVGIGTTTPSKKLEVNGGLRVINEVSIGGGNNFEVDAPGVAGGRFTIATNGNIGIGTNTPAKKLQVNGGDGLSLGFGPGATGEGIGNKRSAGGNQFGLDFYTNSLARMSITNAGNIGINTTNPTAKFEVNMVNANGWNGNKRVARFVAPDNNYHLDLNTYVAASGNVGYQFSANEQIGLCLTTTGKVGVGIAYAAEMPGNYKLYVADGIMTEKVKVALKSTADWADYVFAEGYKLRPLTEVESYVRENKHLPGVPSAEEVQKTGIDMAAMDAKLLEKIEELTLYVIGIQKENEALKARISTLESAKR